MMSSTNQETTKTTTSVSSQGAEFHQANSNKFPQIAFKKI